MKRYCQTHIDNIVHTWLLAYDTFDVQLKGEQASMKINVFPQGILLSQKKMFNRWRCFVRKGVLRNFAKF